MRLRAVTLATALAAAGCDGTDTTSDCVDAATLDALGAHVDDLGQSGALLRGHGGEREAVSSFLFPGYPALIAQYASLIEACTAPLLFEPWCEDDLCWQLECTGDGASHVTHGSLAAPPLTNDGHVFEAASADTAWIASTGEVVLTLASDARSPQGVDLSVDGTATLSADGATVVVHESYPGLVPGGAELMATLDVDATTIEGSLAAGDVVLATFDGHDLIATGDCP